MCVIWRSHREVICGIVAALIIGPGTLASENEVPSVKLFTLPRPALAKPAAADPPGETKVASAEVEELIVVSKSPTLSETQIQAFESMNGGAVLFRPETPSEPAGAIGWVQTKVWDPVFKPEVVKLGKVYVSGGVVNAIKRKNPFCLLHPMVFVASW